MNQSLIPDEPLECYWKENIPVHCKGVVDDCNCTLNLLTSGSVPDPDHPGIFWDCTGLKTLFSFTFFTHF